jgi:hypothetical protein
LHFLLWIKGRQPPELAVAVLYVEYRSRFQFAGKFNRFGLSWSQGATALRVGASHRPAAIMMNNEKLLLRHLFLLHSEPCVSLVEYGSFDIL